MIRLDSTLGWSVGESCQPLDFFTSLGSRNVSISDVLSLGASEDAYRWFQVSPANRNWFPPLSPLPPSLPSLCPPFPWCATAIVAKPLRAVSLIAPPLHDGSTVEAALYSIRVIRFVRVSVISLPSLPWKLRSCLTTDSCPRLLQ